MWCAILFNVWKFLANNKAKCSKLTNKTPNRTEQSTAYKKNDYDDDDDDDAGDGDDEGRQFSFKPKCRCDETYEMNVIQSHFTSQTMHNFIFSRSDLFLFRWIVNGNRCRRHRRCFECVSYTQYLVLIHGTHTHTLIQTLTVTLLNPSSTSTNRDFFEVLL